MTHYEKIIMQLPVFFPKNNHFVHKNILNGVLSGVMNNEEDIIGRLQEDSDQLIEAMQLMERERDELSSKVLVLEQINFEM